MSAFWALIRRDLLIAMRIGGGAGVGLVFFLMLVTIMPFAVGPDLVLLARIGPAILWVAALLATLIGLDRLFQADEEDGSLDLLRMANLPLRLVLVMPLMIPVLIFGISATSAALGGPVPFHTPFAILSGLGLFALVTGTISASLALRASES
jgi:heme exporter protein B